MRRNKRPIWFQPAYLTTDKKQGSLEKDSICRYEEQLQGAQGLPRFRKNRLCERNGELPFFRKIDFIAFSFRETLR